MFDASTDLSLLCVKSAPEGLRRVTGDDIRIGFVDINTAPNWYVILVFAAFAAAFIGWFWLAMKAAQDIDERGGPGWIVGLAMMFFPIVGGLAWLLVRGRLDSQTG
ncbi:MAG: hypothetical protein QOG04_2206 [Actinomycetota bacterium]|nr:hypothetical protein [Actinomycetota bacterium]